MLDCFSVLETSFPIVLLFWYFDTRVGRTDRWSVNEPLWAGPRTMKRSKLIRSTWKFLRQEKTFCFVDNHHRNRKKSSEYLGKLGRPYRGKSPFQLPLSRTVAQRKIKIRNNALEFLLARDFHLIEQKLQSDWEKSIWASRKAWQTVCRSLCLLWSKSDWTKCTKWCESDSSPGSTTGHPARSHDGGSGS